jgi:hypothetical protein
LRSNRNSEGTELDNTKTLDNCNLTDNVVFLSNYNHVGSDVGSQEFSQEINPSIPSGVPPPANVTIGRGLHTNSYESHLQKEFTMETYFESPVESQERELVQEWIRDVLVNLTEYL